MPGLLLHQVLPPITSGRHPAADGLFGGDDGAAVASQHAHARGAFFGKHQALGAAQEEANPVAVLSDRGAGDFRQGPAAADAGAGAAAWLPCRAVCRAAACAAPAHRPAGAIPAARTGAAARCQLPCGLGLGISPPKSVFFQRAGSQLLLQVAHLQRQVGRMDAHRADVVAGQAVKAGIHLLDQVGAELQFAFQPLARQRHPPARRGRLAEKFPVGRADSQAQPAADAVQVFGLRRVYDTAGMHRMYPC